MSDQEVNQPAVQTGEANYAAKTTLSAGRQLAAAREAHGWSVEQVAAQLNLAPRQVHAMERDDYASLPGISIARGFIRSYAKLLKVDVASLLSSVPGEAGGTGAGILPPEALSAPFADTRLPSMADRPVISPKWYVLLVAVILVLAGFWAYQRGMLDGVTESFATLVASKGEVESESSAVAEASNEEAPSVASEESGNVSPPAPSTAEVPQTGPVETEAASASIKPEPAAEPSVSTAVREEEGMGQGKLVLKVLADSWVEIRRADNSIVFSGIIAAGKTESFVLESPSSVVIGNAAGVEATFRGAPLEMKANTSSNVARLNLK